MEKNKNVFIKFQLEKDNHSGELMLTLNFDKNAPNFSTDNDQLLWTPTFEEINFFLETYNIVNKKKTLVEKCDEIKNTTPPPVQDIEVPEVTINPTEELEQFEPVKQETPPDVKEEEYTPETEKKEDDKEIFVQADEEKFDEALKKRGVDVGEGLLLDQEDKNIIDKMLKKREKK